MGLKTILFNTLVLLLIGGIDDGDGRVDTGHIPAAPFRNGNSDNVKYNNEHKNTDGADDERRTDDEIPCGFNFTASVLWSSSVGGPGSPFVASPIIAPLLPPSSASSSSSPAPTGNYLVIAAAFHGEISVVSASTGMPLPGSRYPVHLPSSTIFASPILHDVDSDGALDVVVVTGEGAIYVFDLITGAQLTESFVVVDPLRRVDRKSLDDAIAEGSKKTAFPDLTLGGFSSIRRQEDDDENDRPAPDEEEVEDERGGVSSKDTEKTTSSSSKTSVEFQPRVLASVVIADLNADGRVEEMIIPVSYSSQDYLLTSLLVVNATLGFSILKRVPLELSTSLSEFPVHLLHPPTVVDLDSRSADVEVLVASTSGRVFAFDSQLSSLRVGFPLEVDSVVTPVVAHDLTSNGRLELIVGDRSGVVHCFDTKGNLKWQTSLANEVPDASPSPTSSSSSSSAFSIVGVPRIFDFDSASDSDGLKIGVPTTDGLLFILAAGSGDAVARHALSTASSNGPGSRGGGSSGGKSGSGGSALGSGLLVTRLITKPDDGPPDLVSLSLDGHLHVLTTQSTVHRESKETAAAGAAAAADAAGDNQVITTTTTRRRVTCHERVELGESSLTALLSADLNGAVPGHEILTATHDGVLMALTVTPTSPDGRQLRQEQRHIGGNDGGNEAIHGYDSRNNINDPAFNGHLVDQSHNHQKRGAVVDESAIPAWDAEIPGAGTRFGFVEPEPSIVIKDWTRSRHHVMGEAFSIAFDVGEAATEGKDELLRVKVSLGSHLLAETSITRSGFHVLRVRAPDEPMSGHLIVRMTNRHGQMFADSYPVSLNEALVHDLQWVLLAPFVATVVTYLVVHGYPEEETLPTTVFKGR